MEISEKTSSYIEGGVAAGLGFISWVKTATQKFESAFANNVDVVRGNYSVLSAPRIEDALTLMIGSGAVKALDPNYPVSTGVVQQFPNPMGALNATVAVGAGLLIADNLLRKLLPNKYYKNLPVIPELVRGAGIGITAGGIIGGIWDPEFKGTPPSQAQNNSLPKTVSGKAVTYTAN